MESKLRTCAVCRSSYKFCPICQKDSQKELWYFSFCSDQCHEIYDITSKFENEQIDTSEAKSRLDKVDLSKLDKFGESYKFSISKIMESVPVSVQTEVDKIEDIVDTTNDILIEDSTEVVSENTKITNEMLEEKKNKKSRTRKAK